MKVYHGLDSFENVRNAVVTSGTFDGVHFGHQRILDRLKEVANNIDGESMVITYWPHPRFVLQPDAPDLKLLTTLEEKIALLDKIGIDHLLIIPFDKDFANLTSKQFIQSVLVNQIKTSKLVIGYDHRFGRNREGSFEFLKANARSFGFEVEEIPKQEIQEVAVSSTKIRKALETGDVATAASYLSNPYFLTGKVVKGNQIGRTLGFPTANVQVPETFKLIPSDGIYAVQIRVAGEMYGGMLNIGYRPTVTQEKSRVIEANLFDFEDDLYDETVIVYFIEHLRMEQKFDGLDALKTQLIKDKQAAQKVLKQKELKF